MAVGERLLDAVDVDAVGLERDADPVDAELLEHQQRPVVGGLFDDHLVAGGEQGAEQHPAGLERAVGHHHATRIDAAVAFADPLAEPGVADSRAVGEGAGGVLVEGGAGGGSHRFDGEQVGGGRPAGEGDHGRRHGRPSIGADRRPQEAMIEAAIWAASLGLRPTWTPFASKAFCFAAAVPEEPEMIAPAWPICLPGGAVKPAM